ncbi:hypothetical protein MTBLM1_10193 [Rhodospirillaceae bacterium LM-1]|nr:hypothetical protein MTBLM1_10193 [Rhodospirillaceae bacterium LM-1]
MIARNIQRAEWGQGTIPRSDYEETIALRKEVNRVLRDISRVIGLWL